MKSGNIHGWLILDKPLGLTSTQALGRVKRLLKPAKAGHAGTLDPLATGILPLAFGEATKTIECLMDASKTYQFTVSFGAETETDDLEGKITATGCSLPSRADIEAALPSFIGEITQIPPIYSAIHIDGKRAYDLARKGEKPEIKPREVTVHGLKILETHDTPLPPTPSASDPHRKRGEETGVSSVTLEIDCGKGTYVRAIARDLGRKLGCLGHVSMLRRTRVGSFDLSRAISLEDLEKIVHSPPPAGEGSFEGSFSGAVLPVEAILDDIPVCDLSPSAALRARHGQAVEFTPSTAKRFPVSSPDVKILAGALSQGKLVALGHIAEGLFRPARVFNH